MRQIKIMPWTTLLFILLPGCGSGESESQTANQVSNLESPEFLESTATDNQLNLKWEAVSEATGYRIYYSTNADFEIDQSNSVQVINTENTEYSIPMVNKEDNHYFYLQSFKGDTQSELSQKYVAFSFLSITAESDSIVKDFINNLEWKRCLEGQSWDSSSQACSGAELSLNPSNALSIYSDPDSDGWNLPVFGNTELFSQCSTTENEGSALSNIIYCMNNDDPTKNSGVFNQYFNNPYYKTACESYLSEFLPTLVGKSGFVAKTPVSCPSTMLCVIGFNGSVGCGSGNDFINQNIILNRMPQ